MQPRFEILKEKKLAGSRLITSLATDNTRQLWQSFMPRRKSITNPAGPDLYSVELYPPGYFDHFDPTKEFEKWAAMEVLGAADCPPGMELLELPGGLYAIFTHKGAASDAAATYNYIFREWLPVADYMLDQRPHLAVMGEKYKHQDDTSEEDIWIPVRSRL